MDDPLSLGMFLSLVGLIATYQQLKDGRLSGDASEFQTWLIQSGFRDIAGKIDESASLQMSLATLLEEDSTHIKEKLETIEDVVRSVASRIEGFSKLASAIPHEEYLSDQACDFLKRLDSTQSGEVLCHIQGGRVSVAFLPVSSGSYQPTEPRFFGDDVNKLAGAGWLRLARYNGSGQPIYAITRRGSAAAARLKG